MKVTIHTSGFAGGKGTLLEEGPEKSKIELELFGAKTIVELPNDAFTRDDATPDVFAKYHKMIASDCRWAANVATQEWWLSQQSIDADTWQAYLERNETVESKIAEDAQVLLDQLRVAVGEGAADSEIQPHFETNKSTYQPTLAAWEEREKSDGAAQRAEETDRSAEVERRMNAARDASGREPA